MATQTQQPPQQYLIGVDIGGSHIGLGLIEALTNATIASLSVDINGREITTPEIVKAIVQGCHDLVNQAKVPLTDVLAVGMGCPGQVTNNTLIVAANLPKLIKAPLAQLVSESLGSIHAKLINDADAAISAEVWGNPAIYGRYQHVAMVTLGTGVGFGLILNGRIHQGASGLIEGGHMIVHSGADARRCGCGQQGCVETYASAKSTVQRLQECDALDRQRSSSSSSSSSSPQELNGKVAFDRYSMNDFNAVKVIEETGEYLALLVINVCRVVDPEVIIFGGGLSKAGQPLLEVIKKHVTQRTWKLPTDVKLTLALTDNNGVVGAALAAKSDMLGALVARAPVAATAPAPTTSVTTSTTATVSSPTVAVASPATATSGGDGHRRLARRSSPEPKPRSSSSLLLLSPAVAGAFFAVSSSALLALHFSDSAPGSGSGNSSDLRRWLVPTMTRGLMLGQVGVGALAVYQWMRDTSP